jgi:two-component system, OmpR family, phosphate regulon sensor histidine kinase PhoR
MWGSPLSTLFVLCAATLLSWPIFGLTAALIIFVGGLLILLLHHIYNLSLLFHWLRDPRPETVPRGSGSWEYVFSYVTRLLKWQRTSELGLSKALDRFQLAVAALPDAVVMLNDNDEIAWCNPRAETYFSLQKNRDQGAQITYILRQPRFSAYLHSRSGSDPLTLRLAGEQGERVVLIQLVPYGDSQKLLVGRDITRLDRLETTRRDFIANVSHELRTPLTVVHGYLETLGETPAIDPEFLANSIKLMSEQTARMSRLIDDLLTLSRLENPGDLPVDEDINIPQLIQSLLQEAQALSGSRHKIRAEINTHEWLAGSADELRSAFANLVSNAVRYTPEGGTIDLIWESRDGKPAFAVRDTGIGIESVNLGRLTERFYRVDKGRSREAGGTGLGLAIVKHIANRHQARLEIHSRPGSGSTFRITFPIARVVTPHSEGDDPVTDLAQENSN